MQRKNTAISIEIIVQFLQHKMTSMFLSLVHRNNVRTSLWYTWRQRSLFKYLILILEPSMKNVIFCRPSYWVCFNHQMQLLASKSSILRNFKHINANALLSLMGNIYKVVSHECTTNAKLESNLVIPDDSQITFSGHIGFLLILYLKML